MFVCAGRLGRAGLAPLAKMAAITMLVTSGDLPLSLFWRKPVFTASTTFALTACALLS